MPTAIEPKALHLGILPITAGLLEDMFCLPEGYRIVGISYDERYRLLNFTLMSENLPEVEDTRSLPQLSLRVTCDYLPDQPHEYRKITTEVKIV